MVDIRIRVNTRTRKAILEWNSMRGKMWLVREFKKSPEDLLPTIPSELVEDMVESLIKEDLIVEVV